MNIAVAMSGGVDSTVAALRLQRAGHSIFGLTLKLHDENDHAERDARRAADLLNIPHHVVDLRAAFHDEIIRPFVQAYLEGRTPNPCAHCNRKIKFGRLFDEARRLGADKLATGHYARVEQIDGRWALRKAADPSKDQSYFLCGLTQDQLAASLFPLGGSLKATLREEAKAAGLVNWDKADSEDICFISTSYTDVIEAIAPPGAIQPGEIVDEAGRVLARHEGLHRFTIGQRKGHGVAGPQRLYVLALDGAQRRVVIGPRAGLSRPSVSASGCNWMITPPQDALRVTARIRYRHEGALGVARWRGEAVEVIFDTPQEAVTPGQLLVLYDGDRVLGGGWIDALG